MAISILTDIYKLNSQEYQQRQLLIIGGLKNPGAEDHVIKALPYADYLIGITLLVVGLLGATGISILPSAIAFALIGAGATYLIAKMLHHILTYQANKIHQQSVQQAKNYLMQNGGFGGIPNLVGQQP
jgi:hypothetical protein